MLAVQLHQSQQLCNAEQAARCCISRGATKANQNASFSGCNSRRHTAAVCLTVQKGVVWAAEDDEVDVGVDIHTYVLYMRRSTFELIGKPESVLLFSGAPTYASTMQSTRRPSASLQEDHPDDQSKFADISW